MCDGVRVQKQNLRTETSGIIRGVSESPKSISPQMRCSAVQLASSLSHLAEALWPASLAIQRFGHDHARINHCEARCIRVSDGISLSQLFRSPVLAFSHGCSRPSSAAQAPETKEIPGVGRRPGRGLGSRFGRIWVRTDERFAHRRAGGRASASERSTRILLTKTRWWWRSWSANLLRSTSSSPHALRSGARAASRHNPFD